MIKSSEILPLPRVERVVLAHSPLALAVCQIQFSPVLSVADPAFVAPFQRAIADYFPLAVPGQVTEMQLTFGPVEAGAQPVRTTPQWEFSDRENTWKVVLNSSFVSLETRSYTDFSEFLQRFNTVLAALSRHIHPELGTRIGLRYINELRAGDTTWSHVITQQMLGPLADPTFPVNAEQVGAIQQVTLRYPDHQGITIHHGVIPNGTTVRPRSGDPIPEGEFYLLDADVYREFPLPAGLSMESASIRDHIQAYHDVIYRLFRWSITEDYLAVLKGG